VWGCWASAGCAANKPSPNTVVAPAKDGPAFVSRLGGDHGRVKPGGQETRVRVGQWPAIRLGVDAALRGSSYLKLPRVLQAFTGNIGLHHVHHLSQKLPGYYLQRAHDNNEIFQSVPKVSLWQGLRAVRFKLWDEESSRLVTWREWAAKVARTAKPQTAATQL